MISLFRPARALNESKASAGLSFRQFVMAHETAVFTFCFRMLSNAKTAEIVVQRVFLDIYPQFQAASLATVLTAAHRHCHELLRDDPCPEEMAAYDIQHLYNQLPFPEREVMALRYGCKLNLDEIALILDTSCAAVLLSMQQGLYRAARRSVSLQSSCQIEQRRQ